jgi:hypothetical protein
VNEETPAWPGELLDVAAVRAWIGEVLPGSSDTAWVVRGPTRIYKRRSWGVTARFAVAAGLDPAPPYEVVFKATHLPRFAHAPRLYALLARHVPAHSPDLLARRETDDGGWMLFRPFAGAPLEQIGGIEPLLDLARTIAHAQATLATLPAAETDFVPRVPIGRVPALLDELLPAIEGRYLPRWAMGGEQNPMAVPLDVLLRLARFRPRLDTWAAELAAGPWPLTVDHVGLHDANAVREPNGRVVIFDWEEAVWSCPFFSLDRLLIETWTRTDPSGDVLWDRPDANGASLNRGEVAVRDAYLDALPWGTPAERRRAFDLALCLAPIKTAHEAQAYADALGWSGLPEPVGFSLVRALQRWERLAD